MEQVQVARAGAQIAVLGRGLNPLGAFDRCRPARLGPFLDGRHQAERKAAEVRELSEKRAGRRSAA